MRRMEGEAVSQVSSWDGWGTGTDTGKKVGAQEDNGLTLEDFRFEILVSNQGR